VRKLFIKGFVLVAVLAIITLSVASFDNRHELSDQNALRVLAAEKTNHLDLVFVGSSYVYSGVMPKLFDSVGLKAFDLSVSTAGAFYTEVLIDDFLSCSTTKTICISIAYTTFSDLASDAWDLYPIHRYLSAPLSNEQVYLKYGGEASYIKTIRSSFKKGMQTLAGKRSKGVDQLKLNELSETGGFGTSDAIVTNQMIEKDAPLYSDYQYSKLKKEKIEALMRVLNLCKQKGIQVVFFEPPTFQLKSYFTNTYKLQYIQVKNKLKENYAVIECDDTFNNPLYFRNTDHLNEAGAKKFTLYLISALCQRH
jgi:hypothetical protein